MEEKYKNLRDELDELGYFYSCPLEAIPLVERLFDDLKQTTESLQKYMKIAQNAIEERDSIQFESKNRDNRKKSKSCDDLHAKLIQNIRDHENLQKELRAQIETLTAQNRYLQQSQDTNMGSKCRCTKTDALKCAEQKIYNLNREIQSLKQQKLELLEANEITLCQFKSMENENKQLKHLCETHQVFNKTINGKSGSQTQIDVLTKEKNELEIRLKECLGKQHEAMKRAISLAERNKHLEKELKDIDEMALAVESNCNATIQNSADKLKNLQIRLTESTTQLENVSMEKSQLIKENSELKDKLDILKNTNKIYENDKKKLTDKINNFTIIENDLNKEIDRLNQLVAKQKRKIAEIESQYPHNNNNDSNKSNISNSKKVSTKRKSPILSGTQQQRTLSPFQPRMAPNNNSIDDCDKCLCCKDCTASKYLKEILDREIDYRQQQGIRSVESLTVEKDFYMKEYQKSMEEIKKLSALQSVDYDLKEKLIEKEQYINTLEQQIKFLSHEKYDLMTKLDSTRTHLDSNSSICNNPNCKRLEREREMLNSDMEKVQYDNNELKRKLKSTCENFKEEIDNLNKIIKISDDEKRKLQCEYYELSHDRSSSRNSVNRLQENCDHLKEQLRTTQTELHQQKVIYNQLKILHEQTDKNLFETKTQLHDCEEELNKVLGQIKKQNFNQNDVEKEIILLKKDIDIMRKQLSEMDNEKDELLMALDEKTEKLVEFQDNLSDREKKIVFLEKTIDDLRQQLSRTIDERSTNEHILRKNQSDISGLKQELDAITKIKDSLNRENRRLQDDLSTTLCDNRSIRNELEMYKREVDDLKRQLQQYISEIKRTEDLISKKEIERNELLDQFKCLSAEANVLENNNHTLENEATQSRVQLSVALDHTATLERKLESKDTIIKSYEKQISELTSQVANLEIQIKQITIQNERVENELQNMRDICIKVDHENDRMRRQLVNTSDDKRKYENDFERLRLEKNTYVQDKKHMDRLEKYLHEATQEASDLRRINDQLKQEIELLKLKIHELQNQH